VTTQPGDLLTVEECAEISRAPISSVRHWIRTRQIGSLRAGRRRLIRRRELEAFLSASETRVAQVVSYDDEGRPMYAKPFKGTPSPPKPRVAAKQQKKEKLPWKSNTSRKTAKTTKSA
jgi:excisionase family DNA binding protein